MAPSATAIIWCIAANLLLRFSLGTRLRQPAPSMEAYCAHRLPEGTEGRLPNGTGSEKLMAVAVITRHGQRSEVRKPPKVSYTENDYFSCAAEDLKDLWQSLTDRFRILSATTTDEITRPLLPESRKPSKHHDECAPGQLTTEGFRQQQQLGRYMRAAYPQLLSSLNSSTFYARSTDTARTISSAVALLSEALTGSWPERIPLRVNDKEPEAMRAALELLANEFDSSICPSAVAAMKKQQDAWVTPKSLATSLKNLFGKNVQKLNIYFAMDLVVARSCAGLPLPCGSGGCANDVLAQSLLDSAGQYMCEMFAGDQGGEFATLRAMYPFMMELIDRLRDDAKRWLAGGKGSFSLYSSHDVVVSPLLSALGAYPERCHIPGYASRVVFELWQAPGAKAGSSGVFVRILYNGQALQSIRGCGKQELCPFEDFAAGVASMLGGAESLADACDV